MNRYTFRAISYETGKYVTGHYTQGTPECHYITRPDGAVWQVKPETIGQYIGRTDVSGNPIFEGQKVNIYNWGHSDKGQLGTGIIVFDGNDGCWQTSPIIVEDQYDFFTKAKIEVLD